MCGLCIKPKHVFIAAQGVDDTTSVDYVQMPLDVISEDHVIGTLTGTVNDKNLDEGMVEKVHGRPRIFLGVHNYAFWFTRILGPKWVDLGAIRSISKASRLVCILLF